MKTEKVSPELETELYQKGTKKDSTHFDQKLFTCDKAALRKLHLYVFMTLLMYIITAVFDIL